MKICTKNSCWHHCHMRKLLLVMKITTFILFVMIMQVSASGFAQRITLSKRAVTFKQLFSEITKQTGYSVFYADDKIDANKKINVDFRNADLKYVLETSFKGLPITYMVEAKKIFVDKKEPSFLDNVIARFHAIDVRGKVVDSLGNGLAGANIVIKGGKGSTITNANGEFFLKNIEEGLLITISYLGYVTRDFKISSEFNYVQLQLSTSLLDQVQVMAYGKTSRRLSTGNISSVTSEDIQKQPVTNPLLALQGRVPGLTIQQTTGMAGGNININLRGRNSFSGGNQPLILVDGIPYGNNIIGVGGPTQNDPVGSISALNLLNTQDIESIEVLKDADATAIYGSRGADGVILITTKKGKTGPSEVTLDVQNGIGQVGRRIKLLNTQQYLTMRFEGLKNDNVSFDDPVYEQYPSLKKINFVDLFGWDSNQNTDWQKEMIGGNAGYQDYQLGFSGGSEFVKYTIGGNYHKETTVFKGSSSDKRANTHFSIQGNSANQRLNISINGSLLSNWNNLPRRDMTQYIALAPNVPVLLDKDGNLNFDPFAAPEFGGDTFYRLANNPYTVLFQRFDAKYNNLITNGDFSYSILPGLNFRASMGYNLLDGTGYTSTNPYSSRFPGYAGSPREANFNKTNVKSIIVEPQVTFNKSIFAGNLDVLLGGTYQLTNASDEIITALGFTNDELMRNLSSANEFIIYNHATSYKYTAAFARMTYNFGNRYIVNVNGRRDGSSRFGPGKQFGNFGSIGTAWIFSEENFIKKGVPFISFGKARFSYGTTGKDSGGDYGYLQLYSNVGGNYQGEKGLVSDGLFNNNFAWEVNKKLELSLETGFLKDRILIQGAFYRNRSSNQLASLPIAEFVGPGYVTTNIPALIENKGLEFQLNTINLKSNNFNWKTSFNISKNRNKLLAFDNLSETVYANLMKVGEPIGMTRLYKMSGVNPESGRYEYITAEGNKTYDPHFINDKTVFLDLTPRFFGGLSNTINFKRFTLDFLFQFVKQKGRNYIFSFNEPPGFIGTGFLANQPVEVLSRWQNTGDQTGIQKFIYNRDSGAQDSYSLAKDSDAGYSDASFIRLKNVSVNYEFPEYLSKSIGVKRLNLFILGQNLFTLTRYKGLDPETQSSSSLPVLRVITAGFHLNF